MAKKKWSELSTGQQAAVVAAGAAEVVLTAYVLTDLVRRPASGVRGPKALWAAGSLVQPFGPLTYLAAGRR
ncbi:PLDc N-terminal domain-containing protein [Branchiibius sp. NY16-3462-2]|uniref:PLDc N-terminal domain-containing protein n=1 Tax=Branchiibius sp. NY16-3462-2 TaxID=1807500 RepID=UPI0007955371|nr:PLDc N-terminal domain-containing protein [Branchiibius sp. NY16-3462-2]KYH46060.1 hypothetical protein AZH51_10460 [Branchiibius sp. NY16-3462-2]